MKVGLNGSFWGLDTTGSGQYLRHLLAALSDIAPENQYLTAVPHSRRPPVDDAPAPAALLSTPVDAFGGNLAKLWFEQLTFPHWAHHNRVDLAHVPYLAPPLHARVPVVVTIHDLIPVLLPDYRGSPLVQAYMRLVCRAARRARLVLTDSLASARDIERLLGIPRERIRVVYLAAERAYRPLTPIERLPVLDRLGVPPHYLLYLGGFDRRKNVDVLLRAWAFLAGDWPEIQLVIAGKLPAHASALTPDPRCQVRALGLEGRVHLVGWVAEADKPALYSGALAFVFPSSYEGFGLTPLEAISCGTPAVTASGSSLDEVVGPGGLAVPPGDVEALAATLVHLLREADLRRDLAARGLVQAARFSWEETARQTLAAYRDALDMGPVRPGARP
ncbi:MAG: glycosyltransferase family 4 protein [Anaerolineae bacterium]